MAACRLSRRSATDLNGIYEYTVNFGLAQALRCLNGLHECGGSLAEYLHNPFVVRRQVCLNPGEMVESIYQWGVAHAN